MMSKTQATVVLAYAASVLLIVTAQVSIARALTDAGSIKGTVKASTTVACVLDIIMRSQ